MAKRNGRSHGTGLTHAFREDRKSGGGDGKIQKVRTIRIASRGHVCNSDGTNCQRLLEAIEMHEPTDG